MPKVKVNGYKLFYADDDFADPWRPHDTIMIHHHVWGTHEDNRAWVPTLAREFRVIRLDRRGSGFSQKPPFDYAFTVPDMLSDFLGVLNALGIEKVHLSGQSVGGVLSAAFAATYPERVKSLVLCATPTWLGRRPGAAGAPPPPVRRMPTMAMGSWQGGYRYVPVDAERPEGNEWDELKALYRAEHAAMMPVHVRDSLSRMIALPSSDLLPLLPKITAPTLLLSPSASVNTSAEDQQTLLRTIPNCEQVIIQSPLHPIYWYEPDQCARAVLEFARRHSG